MAGKKIKDLASKEIPNSTDVLIIEDSEATKHITLQNLLKVAQQYTPKELVDATTSYAQSASGTTIPSTWNDTMPASKQGEFLWVRLTFSYSDESEEKKYIVVRNGADGKVDANTEILFTESSTRTNISSGEKIGTVLGKIRKYFADLKDAAFQTVANNLTTTAAGSVLDARQGPIIDTAIKAVGRGIEALAAVAKTGAYSDLENKPALKAIATSGKAADTTYVNTASGLKATNVQVALDETALALQKLKEQTILPDKVVSLPASTTNTEVVLFTAPADGFYFISAGAVLPGGTVGQRYFALTGAAEALQVSPAPSATRLTLSAAVYLQKNTQVKAIAWQNSSGTASVTFRCRYSYIPV